MYPARSMIFFCMCAPAASGKSTICRALAGQDSTVMLSVSTTTRPPRPNEADGREYHFISSEEFEERLKKGLFLEHAEFAGYSYGTERGNLEAAKSAGKDLLLDIDVKGVQQLRAHFAEQVVSVFVFPPSFDLLEARLRNRGTEGASQIEERLQIAREEIALLRTEGFTDYLVINESVADAAGKVHAIVQAEQLRLRRFLEPGLGQLFSPKPSQ